MATFTDGTTGNTLGYAARDKSGHLAPFKFDRQECGSTDVAFAIEYCGICHSDLHQIRGEWGGETWPMVPGCALANFVLMQRNNTETRCSAASLPSLILCDRRYVPRRHELVRIPAAFAVVVLHLLGRSHRAARMRPLHNHPPSFRNRMPILLSPRRLPALLLAADTA